MNVKDPVVEPVLMRPPPPAYETAWERGLRQAKEMRRRSHKRREMDVEYEEKKSSLSLTQVSVETYYHRIHEEEKNDYLKNGKICKRII